MKTIAALLAVFLLNMVAPSLLADGNFRTHCKGINEVPPVDTGGQCQAIFNLTEDGTGLRYKLIVANLEFVTQSHIHLAPAGSNGGVVAFLFGFDPAGATVNGILAQGVITGADLIGALAGMSIADLVAELETGDAYVNVHTQTVPSGEVRGQIH